MLVVDYILDEPEYEEIYVDDPDDYQYYEPYEDLWDDAGDYRSDEYEQIVNQNY
jgi:hypothetical protein